MLPVAMTVMLQLNGMLRCQPWLMVLASSQRHQQPQPSTMGRLEAIKPLVSVLFLNLCLSASLDIDIVDTMFYSTASGSLETRVSSGDDIPHKHMHTRGAKERAVYEPKTNMQFCRLTDSLINLITAPSVPHLKKQNVIFSWLSTRLWRLADRGDVSRTHRSKEKTNCCVGL